MAPRCPMEVAMLLAWALLSVLSRRDGADGANLTLAVVLPHHNTTYPWAWPRVAPAIELAIQKVNAQPDLLPGYTVQLVFASSEASEGVCSDLMAPLATVDLKMAYDPQAFVGPGCVYTTAPVARYTRHWGLPLVTAAAEAVGFSMKADEYALVTRTGASHNKLGDFGVSLSRHFNWSSRVMLLYWDNNSGERPCFFAVEGLYVQLPSVNNMTIEVVSFTSTNYTDLIRDIKQKARSKFSAGLGILPCATSGEEEEEQGPFLFSLRAFRESTWCVLRGTLPQG